jgi:hypothetical protein
LNLLQDIITYVRRIIKSPSNTQITDNLIIDYINRFWLMDVDARIQLFDLKTTYQFQTVPGIDRYNMPLYSTQTEPGSQNIGIFPLYQGFVGPASINGIPVAFYTDTTAFYNLWPDIVQNLGIVATGNGGATYNFNVPIIAGNVSPNPPINGLVPGHIDITGIIALGNTQAPPIVTSAQATGTSGNNGTINMVPAANVLSAFYLTSIDSTGAPVVVSDSGQFLSGNVNYGLLMQTATDNYRSWGTPAFPNGNLTLPGGYSTILNTVNYVTGGVNVTFPVNIPSGNDINAQCFYFESGLPRGILYYNNILTLRSTPDQAYLVKIQAYLTPAAFLNTGNAIPFGYMSEYIARGAARKILADTGDVEQFQFYEPLFIEQERLVWKRSQRQWTATRTPTIYSQGFGTGSGFNNLSGGTI